MLLWGHVYPSDILDPPRRPRQPFRRLKLKHLVPYFSETGQQQASEVRVYYFVSRTNLVGRLGEATS